MWDDVLLEVCHDYIQWLLPTDVPSRMNSEAPLLTEDVQHIFRTDREIQTNFRSGVLRFWRFLGLEPSPTATGEFQLVKAQHFERRILMCWRGPANHNWMRVSRALRSLKLTGLQAERRAFVAILKQIIREHPDMISETAIEHWEHEASEDLKPAPPMEPSTSLVVQESLHDHGPGECPSCDQCH